MTTKLSSKLKVTIDEKEQTLFMSAGLLTNLVELIGTDTKDPAETLVAAGLQKQILKEVLAVRDDEGEIIEEQSKVNFFKMEGEVQGEIIAWVTEHVTDFFMRGLQTSRIIDESMKAKYPKLTSSQDGMENSTSKNQSVGASTLSQAK